MSHPMFDLAGKVAVVSGAAQGMGQATAVAVAEAGAEVALVDRNLAGAEATAETIRSLGRKVLVSGANVSDPDAIAELFRQVDAHFGRVDFLGNIAGDGHLAKPEDLLIDDLHRVLQNLVVGRFAMCQEAGRRMLAQGRGSIMNIGSLASTTALGRGHVAYSMAMGAVVQMTRELSTEWSHRGVRVNCVTPAQVTNPSLIARMEKDPTLEGRFIKGIPAGRMGTPISRTVLRRGDCWTLETCASCIRWGRPMHFSDIPLRASVDLTEVRNCIWPTALGVVDLEQLRLALF